MLITDYLPFVPGHTPGHGPTATDQWLLFSGSKLLFGNKNDLPTTAEIPFLPQPTNTALYLGNSGPTQYFCANVPTESKAPASFDFVELRTALLRATPDTFMIISRASKLLSWEKLNRFCGQCGGPTVDKATEHAKECTACKTVVYPRISPAVIVAIVNNGKLLLARKKDWPYKFHSVIAGFVEAGESLETCAKREAFEEVGIRIKNIRYFASQPWPFPDSLMCAFTSEYDGGEIVVDNVELETADWYGPSELPAIPAPGSVSRKLIDWFVQTYS